MEKVIEILKKMGAVDVEFRDDCGIGETPYLRFTFVEGNKRERVLLSGGTVIKNVGVFSTSINVEVDTLFKVPTTSASKSSKPFGPKKSKNCGKCDKCKPEPSMFPRKLTDSEKEHREEVIHQWHLKEALELGKFQQGGAPGGFLILNSSEDGCNGNCVDCGGCRSDEPGVRDAAAYREMEKGINKDIIISLDLGDGEEPLLLAPDNVTKKLRKFLKVDVEESPGVHIKKEGISINVSTPERPEYSISIEDLIAQNFKGSATDVQVNTSNGVIEVTYPKKHIEGNASKSLDGRNVKINSYYMRRRFLENALNEAKTDLKRFNIHVENIVFGETIIPSHKIAKLLSSVPNFAEISNRLRVINSKINQLDKENR